MQRQLVNEFENHLAQGHSFLKKYHLAQAVFFYTNAIHTLNFNVSNVKDNQIECGYAVAHYWRGIAQLLQGKPDQHELVESIHHDFLIAKKYSSRASDVEISAYIAAGWLFFNDYNKDFYNKSNAKYLAIQEFSKGLNQRFFQENTDAHIIVLEKDNVKNNMLTMFYAIKQFLNRDISISTMIASEWTCNVIFIPKEIAKEVIFSSINQFSDRAKRTTLYERCLAKDNNALATIIRDARGFFDCQEDRGTLKKIHDQLAVDYTENAVESGNIDDFILAINHNPKYGKAYLCYGEYYQNLKNEDKFIHAKSNFQKAIACFTVDIDDSQNTNKRESYFNRGRAYYYLGYYAKAIFDFHQAIIISDKDQKKIKDAENLLRVIFYSVNDLEKLPENEQYILRLSHKHELKEIYNDIKPSDLWDALTHLSSKERAELFEESKLLRQHFPKEDLDPYKKSMVSRTLAKDYIARGSFYYATHQLAAAEKNYQTASQYDYYIPTHSIASEQLKRLKTQLAFCPAKVRFFDSLVEASNYVDAKKKIKKESAHLTFAIIHQNGLTYHVKEYGKEGGLEAYLEALLDYGYRSILPFSVAPNKTYVDAASHPVCVKSKGIPGFKTLKDILQEYIDQALDVKQGKANYINWFKSYLANPKNYCNFIEILAVAYYRREDDLHPGNIAIDLETGHLYLFDTGNSVWEYMHTIIGRRLGVDTFNYRDPKSVFKLYDEKIRNFPCLAEEGPHYNPGRKPKHLADPIIRPIVEKFTDNFYQDEFIDIVQTLGTSETLPEFLQTEEFIKALGGKSYQAFKSEIYFRVWVSEMLRGDHFFRPIAELYVPKDAEHNGENVIDVFTQCEKENNKEFWDKLPVSLEFQVFLHNEEREDPPHLGLYRSLLNAHHHNQKLEKASLKYPKRAKEFYDAMCPYKTILDNYNQLIAITNRFLLDREPNHTPIKMVSETYLDDFSDFLKKDLKKRKKGYNKFFNHDKQHKSKPINVVSDLSQRCC